MNWVKQSQRWSCVLGRWEITSGRSGQERVGRGLRGLWGPRTMTLVGLDNMGRRGGSNGFIESGRTKRAETGRAPVSSSAGGPRGVYAPRRGGRSVEGSGGAFVDRVAADPQIPLGEAPSHQSTGEGGVGTFKSVEIWLTCRRQSESTQDRGSRDGFLEALRRADFGSCNDAGGPGIEIHKATAQAAREGVAKDRFRQAQLLSFAPRTVAKPSAMWLRPDPSDHPDPRRNGPADPPARPDRAAP